MRVLVNALPLRHGGGATYVRSQLTALSEADPSLAVHTLVSPWSGLGEIPGARETVDTRAVPLRFAYEQLVLPLRRGDLLYCPANFGPVFSRLPIVLTLHNPNYYGVGLGLAGTESSRPWWKVKANYASMRRADVIIAISHSFAQEVVSSVPSVAGKVRVIRSGASTWPKVSSHVDGLPERYLLVVSSDAPHKRIQDAVEGWAKAANRTKDFFSLVIVGQISDAHIARHVEAAGVHADQLVHFGSVHGRRAMKRIYERASALVSMSLLEAFPLTPSEAGAVGCPLVLSDIPTHREVTLGHGVFVRPRDTDHLADALISCSDLLVPGSQPWTWCTTWDDNARELLHIFKELLE